MSFSPIRRAILFDAPGPPGIPGPRGPAGPAGPQGRAGPPGYFNVKDFGAVGDGVVNDYAAILAAYDASSAGDTIFFPSGTYSLGTNTLKLLKDDVRLQGESKGASTITYSGTAHAIEVGDLGGASFIKRTVLERLHIQGTSSATVGLYVWWSAFGRFSDLLIDGMTGSGNTGLNCSLGVDNLFERVDINDGGGHGRTASGLSLLQSIENTTVTYYKCYFQNGGIGVTCNTDFSNFNECIIETCIRSSLCENSSQVHFNNVWIENCGDDGLGYESAGYIDATSEVQYTNPHMTIYSGQSTGFVIPSTGGNPSLQVRGGRFDGGWSNTVTGATNAGPIVITSTAHGFLTGSIAIISGVTGNTAANGNWVVTKTDADHFSLNSSTGSGVYAGGGIAVSNVKLFNASVETASMRTSFENLRLRGAGTWSVQPVTLRNTANENPPWWVAQFPQLKVVPYRFIAKAVSGTASFALVPDSGFAGNQYILPESGFILSSNTYYSSTVSGGVFATNVNINGSTVLASGAVNTTTLVDHAVMSNPVSRGDLLTVAGGSSALSPSGGDLVCEVLIGFGDVVN